MANIKFGADELKISRYQTVDFEFTPEVAMSELECLYFTVKQGTVTIEKAMTAFSGSDTSIVVELSQTETAQFKAGNGAVYQIRYKTLNEKSYVTPEYQMGILDVLKDGQI